MLFQQHTQVGDQHSDRCTNTHIVLPPVYKVSGHGDLPKQSKAQEARVVYVIYKDIYAGALLAPAH